MIKVPTPVQQMLLREMMVFPPRLWDHSIQRGVVEECGESVVDTTPRKHSLIPIPDTKVVETQGSRLCDSS